MEPLKGHGGDGKWDGRWDGLMLLRSLANLVMEIMLDGRKFSVLLQVDLKFLRGQQKVYKRM